MGASPCLFSANGNTARRTTAATASTFHRWRQGSRAGAGPPRRSAEAPGAGAAPAWTTSAAFEPYIGGIIQIRAELPRRFVAFAAHDVPRTEPAGPYAIASFVSPETEAPLAVQISPS